MGSLGLPTPRAIGGYSLRQPITFYLSLTRRTIYDTPSTVAGTRGAPSMPHVNDDTRTRSAAGKSTTGTMASQPGVRPPGLSRQRLRLAVPPGDGRGTTTTTPLPGTDNIIDARRKVCGVSALTPRLRAIQWPPNFKVSNVNKYEPKQDPGGWLAVYTTAARAAGATEDVMTTYLPIVHGQEAMQWLQHLP
jgi:hypothetical protein